jgi:hypothetical protein
MRPGFAKPFCAWGCAPPSSHRTHKRCEGQGLFICYSSASLSAPLLQAPNVYLGMMLGSSVPSGGRSLFGGESGVARVKSPCSH